MAAFLAGELSPALLEELQPHLDGCEDCLRVAAVAGDHAPGAVEVVGASVPAVPSEEFELEGVIGRGGMGSVWRARDRRTGQLVAIKQLASFDPDPVLEARFEREIEVLRQLHHPNIVRILGCSRVSGRRQLILEYVPGGSLRQRLDVEPRWTVARVLRLLLELCDALARVHQLGVVHRDLKPENVLLGAGGEAKLADFGLAQLAGERLTATGAVPGTLVYLSPEAIAGLELDARADVWGLGVLAFELLAGVKPFQGATPAATLLDICHRAPPDLAQLRSDLPPGLPALLWCMLEKERSRRIATVRQVAAALEALALGGPSALEPSIHAGAAAAIPHNLPVALVPFIGREQELARLETSFLRDGARLLTVLGPGGVGKSRLALEVLRRALQARSVAGKALCPDGIFLVELARLDQPQAIAAAVAEAIGFPFRADAPLLPQLCAYLQDKQLLLLLDNFEQLLDGAALVHELLQAASGLRVLVTSRERLGLSAEAQLVLDGLSVPPCSSAESASSFSAVQLFVDAARRADAQFALHAGNALHVVRVCELVGGSPLGIVLAAAWVGVLSAQELDAEMSRSLEFLGTSAPDVPARHRSLRAVYEHSWQRLPAEQQAAYAALSVFRGGLTRAAASAVAGADLRMLADLVHKSLVRPRGAARYELHELLRQHSAEKLRASAVVHEVRERHARYYEEFLAFQSQALRGPAAHVALDAIESELGNVHAAWSWMVEHRELVSLRRASDALHAYYDRKGSCAEGESLFGAAVHCLAKAGAPQGEHGYVLGWLMCLQSFYCQRQARTADARELARRGLELLDDGAPPLLRARAQLLRAVVERGSTSAISVIELGSSATERLREAGERWLLAEALMLLGPWLYEGGAPDQAEAALRESIALQCELAGSVVYPLSLGTLGFGLVKVGRFEEGHELLQQALALAQQVSDVWCEQLCKRLLAQTERSRGNYHSAMAVMTQTYELARRYGQLAEMSWCLLCMAELEKDMGQLDAARARLEACPQPPGTPEYFTALIDFNRGDVARREGQLDAAEPLLRSSLRVFERLNVRWAAATALDSLGALACTLGRYDVAREQLGRALDIAREIRRPPLQAQSAAALAEVHARLGEPERAAELLGVIVRHLATEADTRQRRIDPLWERLRGELGNERFEAALRRSSAAACRHLAG